MKRSDRLTQIIDREIEKLDDLSNKSVLTLDDARMLDLLVKISRNIDHPPSPETEDGAAYNPAETPTEDLLNGLQTHGEATSEAE